MKKIILLFILLLQISAISAQQFSITGRIADENNNPIGFATIALWDAGKQNILSGCTSEDNGNFTLENVAQGEYVLSCQFLGYQTKQMSIKVEQSLHMGTIHLQEDVQKLEEVEIKAERIQRKGNGFIVNMQNSPLAKGKSVMNTLDFLPGVDTSEGKISINGRKGTLVYINGRLVKNQQELEVLNAENIKNVEIIPVADVEYKNAKGGVIRIETRKDPDGGGIISFNNWLSIDKKGVKSESPSNTFQYRKGRWSIYNLISGSFGNSHPQDIEKTTRYENGNYNTGRYNSHSRNRSWYDVLDVQYAITPKQTIGIDLHVQQSGDSLFRQSENSRYTGDRKTRTTTMSSKGDNENTTCDITASYRNDFKKGSYFQIQGFYDYTYSASDRIYDYVANDLPYQETASDKSDLKGGAIDANLVYQFKNEGKLVSGLTYSHLEDDNDIAYLSNAGGEWHTVPNSGENYKVSGGDYVAFLSYRQTFGKRWWASAGARYQKTVLKLRSESWNIQRDYQGIYPTLMLSYLLQEKSNRGLSLSYKHGFSLPNYGYYSPARVVYSDNSYAIGNPDVERELLHTVELTYNHNSNLNVTYSFNSRSNLIRVLTFQDSNDEMTTYTKPVNVGTDYNHRLLVDYSQSISESCYFRLSGEVNYEDADLKDYKFSQWYYTVSARINLRFSPTWGATLSGRYYSKCKYADYETGETYSANVSMNKSFLKDKLSLTLQASNLFRPSARTTTISPAGFTSDSWNRNPKFAFNFRAAYRFNIGKKIKSIKTLGGGSITKTAAEQ